MSIVQGDDDDNEIYDYFFLISLSSFFHTAKWLHIFLSLTNTQLNVKTILIQTIQFRISTQFLVDIVISLNTVFLFTHS